MPTRGRALASLGREEPLLLAGIAAAATVFALFSLVQHATFGSGADLAIFDQAIWGLSNLEQPRVSVYIHLSSIFGDHLHPLIALLAPLYWIWEDPRMLLLAQSALVAASAAPVFLFARRRVGRLAAYLVAAAYLAFWGLQTGIAIDFHEVAFAPLLIALAIHWGDLRRWAPYFAAVVLLLLVKEDLSILVFFTGLWLLARRDLRAGLATMGLGAAWYVLATKVLIPALAGGRGFRYWSYDQLGADVPSALGHMVTHPLDTLRMLVEPEQKARTLANLLVPFLGLALLSPVAILAVPLVAERLLSSNQNYWASRYHYSMTLSPVLAMAAADGLARVCRLLERLRGQPLAAAAPAAGAAAMLLAGLVASASLSPLGALKNRDFWRRSAPDRVAAAALERIPRDASVAAQYEYMPHLAHRRELVGIHPGPSRPDYIVARDKEGSDAGTASKRADYDTLVEARGFLLLRRRPEVPESLAGTETSIRPP